MLNGFFSFFSLHLFLESENKTNIKKPVCGCIKIDKYLLCLRTFRYVLCPLRQNGAEHLLCGWP
jgi:hypothetical protein